MLVLALLVALGVPVDVPVADALDDGAPAVEAPPAPATLDAARAALAANAPDCEKRALDVLQAGGLDERTCAEAWSLRARCFLQAGDADRAARSFAAALRIDRDVATVDDESFRRAQAELLSASLAFRATFDGDALIFVLVGDDVQLAKNAALVDTTGVERARVPLEVGHGVHKVSGVDVSDAEARLFDRWGNVIAHGPIEAVAAAHAIAPSSAAPSGPGVLTYVGAGLLGVGMIGLVVAGVTTATIGSGVLTEAPLAVAGLAAGGALFVVGAGFVVVDQGL